MNTIISKFEYENLFKKSLTKQYILSGVILSLCGILTMVVLIWLIPSMQDPDVFISVIIVIASGASLIVGGIGLYVYGKYISKKDIHHYAFDQYIDYETEGTKVPVFRILQYGKNSKSVYGIMDLIDERIIIYDVLKHHQKLFLEAKKSDTVFTFYAKTKNDITCMKEKIDIHVNGKKYRIYGFKSVNKNLVSHLKIEYYQVNMINKHKN